MEFYQSMNKKFLSVFFIGFILGLGIFYGSRLLLTSDEISDPTPIFINLKSDLIQIVSPEAYSKISSPVKVSGRARGFWFFEASFPIKIIDENGNILGAGIAQVADGDWMTENFVSFQGEIAFVNTTTTKGFLIFEKDNPSGLPEKDDFLQWPVLF